MATKTQNPDTLDLDSDRDVQLMEAFIGLIEGNPDEVVHGWFSTADVQLALFKREGLNITPDEMRRTLRHFVEGLQLDSYDPVRDKWALYDPQNVQSLCRLALAQSGAEEFTSEEGAFLSRELTRAVNGEPRPRPKDGESDVVSSLIDKGLLHFERGTLAFAGRLGEWASMGGGESFFEDLPSLHGNYIPDADWGWRHGGIMYLSDSKLGLQDKIRSVWKEHRRESPVPSPNPTEFESVLALALDFEVEIVPTVAEDA